MSYFHPEEAPEPIIIRLQEERRKARQNQIAHFQGSDPAEIEARKKPYPTNSHMLIKDSNLSDISEIDETPQPSHAEGHRVKGKFQTEY